MKSLRQFCATLILTVVFATATFAEGEGVIHGGAKPPSPPTATATSGGATYGGLTATNIETQNQDATAMDLATEITLLLVQNMLALF